MYYTKKEYNDMKNALSKKITMLEKQVAKLQNKLHTGGIVFTPDFSLDTTD